MSAQYVETLIVGAGQAGLATAYHLKRRRSGVLIVDANAQIGDYLEQYALQFDLPVRTSTRVDRIEARPDGGYVAIVGEETIRSDNVVVATGTFGRRSNNPAFAAELDPAILQLHLRLPILDEYGRPVEDRGIITAAPGLFFCRLSFPLALSSMVFPGISRDADYIARQIVAGRPPRPGPRRDPARRTLYPDGTRWVLSKS
jgi:glycine/D-amino acid oxidase-like deaminating enzyme